MFYIAYCSISAFFCFTTHVPAFPLRNHILKVQLQKDTKDEGEQVTRDRTRGGKTCVLDTIVDISKVESVP